MFHSFGPRWAVLIALGAALSANAQQPTTATPSAAASCGDAAARSGGLSFRSALHGYQKFTDEKVGSWRDANDNVGRIGGWREYAKEAQGGQGQSDHGAHGSAAPAAQGASNAPAQDGQTTAPARPAGAGAGGHGKH